MHLEEFAKGQSLPHTLDPRTKIAAAAYFSVVAAVAERMPVLLAGLAVGAALVVLAKLPVKLVLVRLAIVNSFIIFLWFFLPFSGEGTAVFAIGPLTATREGLEHALAVTLKSNAVILAAMALLSTSTVFHLVHALRHMHVPEKLVGMFFFTFRYFQVIHEEYLRLRTAMRVRCFRPRTNFHTYRSVAYLMGMVLVRSFDRAERVHQAMLCRGYTGKLWILSHFHYHDRDGRFLAVMVALTTLLAVIEWIIPIP
jgi:cobalt/nickel transport system permease protein